MGASNNINENNHQFIKLISIFRNWLSETSEAKTPEFDANTEPVLRTLFLTKSEAKTPEFDAN